MHLSPGTDEREMERGKERDIYIKREKIESKQVTREWVALRL
jgi:hypothetical protein